MSVLEPYFKAFMLFCTLVSITACKENALVEKGATAPEFGVIDLDGQSVQLGEFGGKITVLNFWQGGCIPCLTEMPHLQALHEQYKDQRVRILSVNSGGSAKIIQNAIAETGVSYEFAIDELNVASARYQIHFFPTTFVIDKKGIIREKMMGEIKQDSVATLLDEMIKE